jgi:hypothetical protein
MAVQNRDRSDVGFFDSPEYWKQSAFFFRKHSLDLLVPFLNRYQDSTHRGDKLRHGFLMTGVIAEGVVVSIRVGPAALDLNCFKVALMYKFNRRAAGGKP